MVIHASGTQLSFRDIEAEFGQNGERSLGDYRVSEDIGELTNLPLDAGIPTSGQIKFSDFYSKQLNIVMDLHSSNRNNYNLNVYDDKFQAGSTNYDIVGNFKETIARSQWQGGKKVIIHVNKRHSSNGATAQSHVAVDTGNWGGGGWPNDTTMQIDIGSNGIIGGKGGNGGSGGSEDNNGSGGGTGTSGLRYKPSKTTLNNNSGGRIVGGGGGGGGGGGAEQNDWNDRNGASGGGGGGGNGYPVGSGGGGARSGGSGNQNYNARWGGAGGEGGEDSESEGGDGGNGGGFGFAGADGGDGRRSKGEGAGGGSQYITF
tara:strand:+ start:1318 stop:2265 length:948 start_codon:yes stop_codon:yes gene_type:complete